jgi:hypothetical protein
MSTRDKYLIASIGDKQQSIINSNTGVAKYIVPSINNDGQVAK